MGLNAMQDTFGYGAGSTGRGAGMTVTAASPALRHNTSAEQSTMDPSRSHDNLMRVLDAQPVNIR
jgi:hypothetical protein